VTASTTAAEIKMILDLNEIWYYSQQQQQPQNARGGLSGGWVFAVAEDNAKS